MLLIYQRNICSSLQLKIGVYLEFKRIKKMLDVAKEKNVFIAFENLRNLEYLEETMNRFGLDDNAICCFDVGHANCFSKNIKTYDFPRYKGLIKCLHIHDNNGERAPIICGCSSMVEHQPSKLDTWVRFPSPAFMWETHERRF